MKEKQGNHRQRKPTVREPGSSSRDRVRQIEQRLATILEATTEGYWDWRLTTGEVDYGQGWLSSLGYLPDDPSKDESFLESMIHPEDLNNFQAQLQDHLIGKTPSLDCEVRLRAKSGHYKWFRTRGKVVQRDASHRAQRLVGMVLDIDPIKHAQSELTKSQEALRKSEEKFHKGFMESPMAMTLTSAVDYRYIEVNEFFEIATEYSREEVIGKTPFDINFWLDPDERISLAKKVVEAGRLRNVELQFRTRRGEIRYGLASAELIEIGGEPCILAVTQDITDRKRAEQALRDGEERLRLAIRTGRMYAFEWDPRTDIIRRSEESSNIIGYNDAELEQPKRALLARIHPDDRHSYDHAINSLTPANPTYKVAFRLMRPDNSTVWLDESGRGFFEPDGSISRVVGMIVDVTESRQSERALSELSGKLITQQEEERRRVARDLHDNIGQELALLAVQAQRIDSGASDEENTTRSDVHDLYKRIKDIATKVSTLSHRLHSSELDYLGLGVAAERLCRDFSAQYGIDLNHDIRNLPQRIDNTVSLCFYRLLQEALQNVANHSQATRVSVRLTASKDQLILEIEDNGIGFEAENLHAHSGLGIVSMRERIRLVGGQISVNSKLGRGVSIRASVHMPSQNAIAAH